MQLGKKVKTLKSNTINYFMEVCQDDIDRAINKIKPLVQKPEELYLSEYKSKQFKVDFEAHTCYLVLELTFKAEFEEVKGEVFIFSDYNDVDNSINGFTVRGDFKVTYNGYSLEN